MEEFSRANSIVLPETYVVRPRIRQLFSRASQNGLISVCAGAGYGKTSVVYSFLSTLNAEVNWLHLTEQDNTETNFWENYIHTVYKRVPDFTESLLETGMPKTKYEYEKYFSFTRALYPALMKRYKNFSEYVFVYDDLHNITNPNVLQFIDQTTRFKTPNKITIVVSRRDPMTSLPYLVAEGIVPSITEEDLRFTDNEIAEYLRRIGVSISTQGVQDIYRDTQGWVFAIVMIGRSLQKSPEYRSDIFSAMRNNVYKIFDAEILNVISEQLKNLLIRLSLLDRIPAELLSELAANDATIAELEQQSAYMRYDPYMNTYIIHQLLLSYLSEYQYLLTDDEKRDTYKKAGDYCVRNNYKADAIIYYEKAGDYASITELVYYKMSMQIPEDIAENLLRIFDNAPARISRTVDLFPILHMRAYLSLGRMAEAIELGERYEKQFLALQETRKTTQTLAGIYLHLGLARELQMTYEDKCDFNAYYMKMYENYVKNPFPSSGASTVMMTGSWASIVGVARAGALDEYVEDIGLSEQYLMDALNGYGAGRSDITSGELMFYRNDFREAERLLAQGLQKARTHGQFSIISRALFYVMRIAFLRGNAEGASKALHEMKDLLPEEDYVSRYATYDIAVGWYYLKLGRPAQVPDWLQSDFLPYIHPRFIENFGNQIKMLYCYATKNHSALLSFTGRLKERGTILYERLESQVLEACTYYQLKDKRAAFDALREAYETAIPNHLIAPFIELGKDMRTLTAAAMREDDGRIPMAWLKSLNLQSSAYAKHQSHISASLSDDSENGIRLSGREKEVLSALSRGLSRSEIAESLRLSPNTVKMITGSLYEKLGASTLADAIRIGVGKNLV